MNGRSGTGDVAARAGALRVRAGIVDDERLARERLRQLLEVEPDVDVVFQCADGTSAVAAIIEHTPDIVFLDVQMPDGDGFMVVRLLTERLPLDALPLIVFVTAYDDHAVRAFDAQALDYLVKPFDDARFRVTLDRVRRHLDQQRIGEAAARLSALLTAGLREQQPSDVAAPRTTAARAPVPDPAPAAPRADGPADPHSPESGSAMAERSSGRLDRIVVKRGASSRLILAAGVDWIEAEGVYARLHIGADSFLIRMAMHELEARLDPRRFARIHRSTIVNLDRVRELFGSENSLVLHDGTVLAISRSRKAQLEKRLGQSL